LLRAKCAAARYFRASWTAGCGRPHDRRRDAGATNSILADFHARAVVGDYV
jgi:hypothetical protein